MEDMLCRYCRGDGVRRLESGVVLCDKVDCIIQYIIEFSDPVREPCEC